MDTIQIQVTQKELTSLLLSRARQCKELHPEDSLSVLKIIANAFDHDIDYDAAIALLMLVLPIVGVALSPQIMALIYGIGKMVSNE